MATKKKTTTKKSEKIQAVTEEMPVELKTEIIPEPEKEVEPKKEPKKSKIQPKKEEPKYKIGSIVFISKNAEADLNGFKLFPQYKKYTYTVEAYDQISDVYTLRRLNLSLQLKSTFIVAPDERAHDSLHRRQF